MSTQTKKWYEKLFELVILFFTTSVAFYLIKSTELGSNNFYYFLAFGFAFFYNSIENIKYELEHLSKNNKDNFTQAFDSLQRKYDEIQNLENQIFDLKMANKELTNQIDELRYEMQTKQ